MNSYLLRRLFPFYSVALLAELIFTAFSMLATNAPLDVTFFAIVKTFGVLILTTTSAFLVLMLPFVFYLFLLPQKYQNSKLDKIVSYLFYFIFLASTLGEEMISAYFWQSQNLPVSLAVFRHTFSDVNVLLAEFFASSYVILMCLGALILLAVLMFYTARFTLTTVPAPKWFNRLFQTLVYAIVCVMTYMNINPETLSVSAVAANNQLSEEGTYLVIKESVDTYTDLDFSKPEPAGAVSTSQPKE